MTLEERATEVQLQLGKRLKYSLICSKVKIKGYYLELYVTAKKKCDYVA